MGRWPDAPLVSRWTQCFYICVVVYMYLFVFVYLYLCFQVDPVLLTKTWINPTQARVVMEPLSAFGEKVVNDAFGDRVTITRVDRMPERERRSMSRSPLPEIRRSKSRSPLPEIRKSSRSPINPVELREDNRRAQERKNSAHSCASHNGTTPRQQKRALDILNLPGTVNSSRSPSPSQRRRKKSESSRGSRSGSSHHILDECDSDKWSGKPRNTQPSPSPRSTKSRSSRRKTERHELYDADRRSPMPPRRSPRPEERKSSRGPKSRGKSKEEGRDASMERERVPSARSRRLYRNEFYYSDGFTESASSDDWPTPTKKKTVKASKKEKESKKSKKEIDPSNPKSIIGIAAISKAAMLAKGARRPEQEANDPWGGNSPMRRIEKLEASFGPDQEGPMDHSELELEDEILQEAEETLESQSQASPTETEVEDVGGGRAQPLTVTEPKIVLSTEYELPVYDSHPTKESMNLTMLGTFGEKEQDGDSCLGLSIDDRSSAPSTEPQSRIQAAFALEDQEENKGRFVFEPLPMLQVVGRVRDTATGEVFEVYTDGPPPPIKDFDCDTFTVGSSKSEEEEEEDVGWCSCYFFIRAIGLVCVVALIAGLIILSVYGR